MVSEFKDNREAVKEKLQQCGISWLHEAAGELCGQVMRNQRVRTGRTKGSWRYVVDEAKMEAYTASDAMNAVYEEFGTGEYIWNKFGLTMEQFRKDIKAAMDSGPGSSADVPSYTNVIGKAAATIEQMQEYIKKKNPKVAQSVLDMIPLYLSEGEAEGVRGDIAFAQSCLETGNFGFSQSAVTLDQNNFAGMGVTQNGMKGLSFDTPQLGIRCQIQHLKAYACTDALVNENIDPRFKYVVRGSAPYVEWLGIQENPQGKGWAAGAGYGAKILNILKNITGAAGNGGNAGQTDSVQAVKPLSGFVKVFYKGKDGLNVRTSPCMGDNVDQVVYDGIYTVTGISEDGQWYRLKSGLYITTGKGVCAVYGEAAGAVILSGKGGDS